jgi:parallel beta-helix repeat protein
MAGLSPHTFRNRMSCRSPLSMIVLASVLVFAGLAVMAEAPTIAASGTRYYVATTGNDSNPGTMDQPWRTIQYAVGRIDSGDTIYVRDGTYPESIVISSSGAAGAPKTLTNYPNETVIVNGSGNMALRTNGAVGYWTIQGITLRSTNRYAIRLGWWGEASTNNFIVKDNKVFGTVFTIGSYHVFEGNEVDGTGYSAAYGDAGLADADISHHNVFRNNTVHDFTHVDARGIWTQGKTHDTIIEGNNVYNIVPTGGLGQCIDLDGAGNVDWRITVRNNTVNNCGYVGIQLENSFDCIVENNIIKNSGSAGIIVISYDARVGCKVGGENNQYGDTNGDSSCKGDPTNDIIRQNLIHKDTGWDWGYGGIINWGAGSLKILGNTINAGSGSGNAGINFQDSAAMTSGAVMQSNIIYQGSGVAICALDYASFAEDSNNLVYKSNNSQAYGIGSDCTASYSLGQYQSMTGKGQGSVQANPLFKNATSDDFHLQAGSPAIDAAVYIGLDADLDGNPRPQGLGYDIGAYEYAGAIQPTATPTMSSTPTWTPTWTRTPAATATHSPTATMTPTNTPTVTPSHTATSTPTGTPALAPTSTPTYTPTSTSTATPTPTVTPSYTPESAPTSTPSGTPTPSNTATYPPTSTSISTAIPSSTPTISPTSTPNALELIVDNTDSRFSTSFGQDPWREYTQTGGRHYGDSHYYNPQIGTGQDIAVWSFAVPKPGRYEVYAWWWDGNWRPRDVPYTINHLEGSTTVRVNQQINGGQWNLLGTFGFQEQGSVMVCDDVSSGHDLVADAVRLVFVQPLPSATGTDTPTATPTQTPKTAWTSTPTSTSTSTSTPVPTTGLGELVVDNTSSGFSTSFGQDMWQEYRQMGGRHYGGSHVYNRQKGTGQDTAVWSFTVPQPGTYQVYAWWWDGWWRPPDVPYTVNHLGGSTTVRVSQQVLGGRWNLLGVFSFRDRGSVVVSDNVSSGHDIVADAIKVVYLGPQSRRRNYRHFFPVIYSRTS